MYIYIKGEITSITNSKIILECNNIGYKIYVKNTNIFKINNNYKIYLYEYLGEKFHHLFGFISLEELELFKSIISIKGIGVKIAMLVLKNDYVDIKNALNTNNIIFFTSINGIGIKTAQQIITKLNKNSKIGSENKNFKKATLTLKTIGLKKEVIMNFKNDFNNNETEKYIVQNILTRIKNNDKK